MLAGTRTRIAASGWVLLALGGVWIGHTAEYLRVWGAQGLREELVGSVHAYMLPAAVLLAVAAALAALRMRRRLYTISLRIERARSALESAWRRPVHVTSPAPEPSRVSSATAVWLTLSVAQIVLYVLQEAVEAAIAGRPADLWSSVSGIHWTAPLIQAVVALLLTLLVTASGALLRRRDRRARGLERLVGAIVARRLRSLHIRRPRPALLAAPATRFGLVLWGRPPPALSV